MKKQHTLALLLMAGLMLGSCSSDDNTAAEEPAQPQKEVKTYHATTVASMGEDGTRTLSLDGTELNVGWATTENVYVLVEDDASTGGMNPTTIENTAATLEGDLTGSFSVGDEVTLRFPRANKAYFDQWGTLADIAENFDYAELTTEVESVSGNNITIKGGTLESQQAIVKFTFNQSFTRLSIVSDILSDMVTVRPASATNEVYVALPIGTSAATTFYFTAENSSTWYQGTKTVSVSMQNGKYYTANVSLSSVTTPAVGNLYYSDGTWSSVLDNTKTPVGVIVDLGYWGEFTEMGLVMCLKNIDNYAVCIDDDEIEYPGNSTDGDTDLSESDGSRSWICGYTVTKALAERTDAATSYPAAYQARNYTGLPAPASSTGWFVPDVGQWAKCMNCLGGYGYNGPITPAFENEGNQASQIGSLLDAAMSKAGTSGTDYNPMGNGYYWSVTRNSNGTDEMYNLTFDHNGGVLCESSLKSNTYLVRPFLAF